MSSQASNVVPIAPAERQPLQAPRPIVWIVDDSPVEAQAVRSALSPEFDCVVFSDGSAVLERASDSTLPDVLVLDWLMPGVNGVDVCRYLRTRSDRLPVLLVTVQGEKEHLAEGLAAGANDFVAKPFSVVELHARVRALLANRRLHDRIERAERERAEAERQRAEAERQRAEAAEERARLAELYLGIIGHDLRNPLSSIHFATRAVKLKAEKPEVRELADKIARSSQRMVEMISALLDVTRSRLGGGLQINPAPTDFRKVCEQVIDELATMHPGRRIEFEATAPAVELNVDPHRMAQVVSNLVSNAIVHGSDSAPVQVRLSAEPHEARLAVTNHGTPIPPEVQARLFDPFRRGTLPNVGPAGLGLGLYISQQIVAAHGGHIDVATGDVTTFTVHLPIA